MATLSLKISLEGGKVVKTIQFDPSTAVYDACRIIREKILEASAGDPKEYGLFLASEEDNKKGIWLEASRSLDYYMLRNGDLLEYNKKTRNLRVRMLDGTVKTLLVDDSQIVANLMVVICTKIGITNYDEYGLVREEQKDECDPCDKPNFGTLTLRRKHQERERDAKMDQLRKKLRTDDEVNWVEGSKTLREQGIEVGETLLLRRKLFFSDRNVDARDPVQLTLLYVQARDAMLDGTHPITQDKACEFAGIQCQIQFGDHKEDKHTTGFLDLKEFLPASYMKIKGIEKKVFKEHKKHAGLSELDAKVLYTKNARDLKTYGVAFFLVKEKMKGKNKLVPRLLGVTKDSVLRLDEKTKEILQTWPLTTVRRWCASPNTFTLDFGDYSDQYYSVQTTEAEQILQVIAGYIDIIVRKRRARDHLGIEGDEGSAMLEDSVAPSRANIIQHDTFKSERKVNTESVAKPAVVRPGAEGAKPFAVGHVTGAQQTTISGQIITGHTPPAAAVTQKTHVTSLLSAPQRALLTTISSGREVIKQTEERLQRAELPALGQDASSVKWRQVTMDTSKQVVTSQIAAMNAATAQVVTLTSGPTEEVDHTAVGAAITTITTNLPEMTKGVQMLAALMEDSASGDRLLDATRHLCNAFSDLLKAAEPETKEPRQNLLNAASRVGEASTSVLHTIGEENEQDKETQDILLSLAKAVANTTAALVLKAKNVAAHCKDDQPLQNTIIQAATSCALATSQLVACTKVVAPTLSNPACREQLSAAARAVALAVDRLVAACQPAPAAAAPAVEQLTAAAQRVSEELERLLRHCDVERRPSPVSRTTYVESVVSASERVWGAADSTAMLRHARSLGQATAHLITSIKTEAESQPSESQRRLLAAAKLLADATARMVEAARQCASSPQDREKQDALRRAAEEVREIAADYAHGQDVAATQVARLADATMRAADAATQLATAAGAAARYNANGYTQEILESSCSQLTSAISPAVGAARRASPPAGAAAQLDLIAAAEGMLQTHGSVSAAVRGAMPSVSEPSAARRLADTAQTYNAANADLRSAVSRARISCKGVELEAAAEILRALQQELDEVEEAARAYELTPLPGQTAEWSAHTMSSSSRIARSSAAQLVTAARLRDRGAAGAAAGDLAAAMREFSQGVRGATAVQEEMQTRERVISSGRQVLHSSLTLVETVTHHLETTETIDSTSLVEIAQDISQGLEQTMAAVPSHAELERVIEEISETLNILSMGEFPPSDRTYSELQTELTMAAEELNSASGEVAERPGAAAAAQHYRSAHDQLMGVAMEMAGHQEEQESRTLMVSSMKTVTVTSTKLLTAALAAAREPARAHHRHHLPVAARAVTDAINHLVDVCTEASPGQKECAAAIRSIEAARALLAPSDSPRQDLGYYGCLDAVVAHSKGLSEGMSGMASAVKRSQPEPFAAGVRAVAAAVRGLVESAAQAAYLVAVSSPQSVAGRAGLVDQAMFARAQLAIDAACDTLADSSTTQQQVLTAATEIAKYTSALCNACRAASAHTAAAAAKRHFVQAAKDVANSTAALVKEIKALDADYSEANRTRCAAATAPLRAAVRSLCQFADGPEFAAVPARISAQGRIEQKQILDCGRNIITGSCAMLESARRLALTSGGGEREHWQALASHSKSVSDAIKDLVHNIREKAPGQAECASAIELLADQQRILDQTSLQQVAQELEPRNAYTLQGYSEQVENSTAEMLERLEPLRVAAAAEAENLGHAVTQLVSYASPLVSASAGAASLARAADATAVLLRARTVLEALSSLVGAAKQAAGNPRAVSAHGAVSAGCEQSRVALTECGAAARDLAAHHGAVRPLLDAVARAKDRLTDHRMSLVGSYDEADSFVDYQTRMVAAAKEIVRLSTDMTAKAATDPSQLLTVANELVQRYEALARDAVGAAATTPNADIANRLRISCVELGEAVGECCLAGGRCRAGNAPEHQREVATASRHVGEKAVQVLGALQAGSRGTQACIDAAATIAALLGDIDTTILFASAGTLHSDVENDTFALHREAILRAARALVEHTKGLVAAAAGSQDQLADAAGQAVTTVVQLCSVVKLGAASLGGGERSAEPQVLVLNAARDAAAALRDLAAATAAAAGKALAHPDMERLKHAARRRPTKRWSLPAPAPGPAAALKRLSLALKESSCDSETDVYQSDQEPELVKLLDYSSQDDDISPTIFYDNCEEVISYLESLIRDPPKRVRDDVVNERYNLAAKNSLIDMEWRVMKYGENIFLGEVKRLADVTVEVADRVENRRKRDMLQRLKANNDLDKEMKRLSQVIEDMDTDVEPADETDNTLVEEVDEVPDKKAKLDEKVKLRSPVFKVKKVRPVNLVLNLSPTIPDVETEAKEPPKVEPITPEQRQKDESTEIVVKADVVVRDRKPDVVVKDVKIEFWKMFKDDSEWWKALAKRNLEKMEETRKELQRFSGHELVLGEFQTEIDRFDKEKLTLQTFIDEVDESKAVKRDLQYDKKYEDMVLKLIDFAKKDFIYKGFDPLIEKLKALSNIQIEGRKKKIVNIQDIINIYTQIDISRYTYEELCLLEKYYKEIIRKYKRDNHVKIVEEKENIVPRCDRSPSLIREVENRSAPPSYHRNVILNVHSSQNLTKNVNSYSSVTLDRNSLQRSKSNNRNSQTEIFDLTRTYPMEYYANNWWSIYEDVLKSREEQFGSIDKWWHFYEAILNKSETKDEEANRIRAVVEYRNSLRRRSPSEPRKRPNSRMEEQLRMLEDIHNERFRESEDVQTANNESVMVTNVTSLLKTVKAVEDEHTRGTRALESTIEAISQEIEVLQSPSPAKDGGSPEEVVRATRRMTAATARAVAAGNCAAQDQLTAAANLGRRTVAELLLACKNAAWSAETPELRARTIEAGRAAAAAYRALLQAVLQAAQGDSNAKHSFPELSRRVAHTVADIIAAAELLKGSDWVDPDDPTVIAETELLGAAASIDAAAKKLDALRPRKAVKVQEADESLNFDEMILEAAKSIIAATSALVRAASAAQRELIDQGKVARRPASSSDDGQWSEGLVSAARLVAAAAHALVEAANALVQGAASEERLISAARHVASSTAQLLVACKVKADPSSESTRRLQSAGAEVIRSTDNLVRAARDAISCEEERSLVLNRRMVGGIAQEIDARSEVLRIEKELEEARGRLTAIRQAKYKLRTGDTSGDETDHGQDSDASGLHGYRPTSSFANTTYSPNSTQTTHNNTTNLSHHVSQLNQSIHGPSSPGYGPGYQAQSPGYLAQSPGYTVQSPGYTAQSPGFSAQSPGYIAQSPGYTAQSPGFSAQSPGYIAQSPGYTAQSPGYQAQSPGYQAQSAYKSEQNQTNGYMQTQNVYSTRDESQKYTVAQTPSFTSFRPQEENKQNYQGFTTHDSSRNDRTMVNNDNYETRLYDTPRPAVPVREDYRQESQTTQTRREHRSFDTQHTAPMSPKFNARELKFEDKDYAFSPLKKPLDGVGQTFTEHHKSTEAIPGGTRQSEFTVKSESYSSGPKVEYGRTVAREETKSPFVSSTPAKFDKSDSYNQYSQHSEFSKNVSSDLVKVPTPDYERISSPYGKEVHSYGGPNYMEETTTEVKEIPNGTQKVTTTKIYSSSPVNLTTTNTKYEPIKLEGIDELSKSFDNDSKYSTMDSRFNTLDSKMSSDTSRSFMRPSDFQSSDYQATTSVSKVKKPSELVKELDAMDKKFSKQTVTSERIEKKSVMTSSHKSETSSTVTKKFGNF